MKKAFVYIVINKSSKLKYIGARYGKNSDTKSLWSSYFTSSIHVKKLIDLYGKEDFQYRVIKTFDDSFSALSYENSLIKLSFKKKDYVNFHPNFIGNLTKEEFEENERRQKTAASIQGRLCVKDKTGIFALTPEERRYIASLGGFAAGKVNKERGTGIFSEEVRERQHKTLKEKGVSAYYDKSTRAAIASLGGKNGYFSESYAKRNGISPKDMRERQSERGKIGGAKNKGFIWYTDGKNSFKYTKREQLLQPFEVFLEVNKQFKKGRQ